MDERMTYSHVDERSLIDVDANEVVEPGFGPRNSVSANGGQFHEALDSIRVCDLLFIAQRQPFFPDRCVVAAAARVVTESSMAFFQLSLANGGKSVSAVC
jgi:hypothetical protein